MYRNQWCNTPKSYLMFMNGGFPGKTRNQWQSELIATRNGISGMFQDFGNRCVCYRWKSFASKCVVERERHYHNSDNPSKASLGSLPAPPSGAELLQLCSLPVYTERNISSAQLSRCVQCQTLTCSSQHSFILRCCLLPDYLNNTELTSFHYDAPQKAAISDCPGKSQYREF